MSSAGSLWARVPRSARIVAGAMAVSGLCSYGFLAIASRSIPPAEYSRLAAAWTLVYVVEPALFAPVAHVLARNLAAGRVKDDRAALGSSAVVGLAVLAVIVAIALLGAGAIRGELFDGDRTLFVVVLLAMPAQLLLSLAWGLSIGRLRYSTYGRLHVVDGLVRFGAALSLGVAGAATPGLFALPLAAGPVAALLWNRHALRPPVGRAADRRDRVALARAATHQIASSGIAIAMLSLGPIVVKVLAPAERAADAGRFQNALSVSQAPLMIAGALLVALLPSLARLAADHRYGDLRRRMVRLLAGQLSLSLVAVVLGGLAGPAVVRLAYGDEYDIPRLDFALLVAGSMCFWGAQLVAQPLLALRREGRINVCYALGALAMAATIASIGDLLRRVELGFLAGTATTYALLLASLVADLRRRIPDGGTRRSPVLAAGSRGGRLAVWAGVDEAR